MAALLGEEVIDDDYKHVQIRIVFHLTERKFEVPNPMLKSGILKFMNQTHYQRFIMIIRSAGFIDSSMIRSKNVLNFAYIIYLLTVSKKTKPAKVETIVRSWIVMSILTGRYSDAPESQFDLDIRHIDEFGIEKYLLDIEESELSDAFWSAGLLQRLGTSVSSSPLFGIYLETQVKANDRGFLSRNITVADLINHKGNIHHLFPRNYLKKNGLHKGRYNQITNYVMMQSEINIAIREGPRRNILLKFLKIAKTVFPSMEQVDLEEIKENFKMHCIPDRWYG